MNSWNMNHPINHRIYYDVNAPRFAYPHEVGLIDEQFLLENINRYYPKNGNFSEKDGNDSIESIFYTQFAQTIRQHAVNLIQQHSFELAQLYILNNLRPLIAKERKRKYFKNIPMTEMEAKKSVMKQMIITLPNMGPTEIYDNVYKQFNNMNMTFTKRIRNIFQKDYSKNMELKLSKFVGVDSNVFGSCPAGSPTCLVQKIVMPLHADLINMNPALNPYMPNKYPLLKRIKGGALFIGNSMFSANQDLNGIDVDLKNFNRIFSQLGFLVHSLENISGKEMEEAIKIFLNQAIVSEGMDSWESLVIGISSHGKAGKLFGADDRSISVREMLSAVNSVLPGRPKMVLMDACRSGGGIFSLLGLNDDSPATMTDVIVGYSSPTGEDSLASDTGSYFFTVLFETLAENACCFDVATILDIVSMKMQQISSETGKSQVNDTSNTLTKLFYLNPQFGV